MYDDGILLSATLLYLKMFFIGLKITFYGRNM